MRNPSPRPSATCRAIRNTTDAAYAQYLMASSYYDQIPDITRDQEKSERAILALQELVQRYPTSEYAADASKKLQVASDQLAGKELEVGRFYLQKRNYAGAINRFRTVVSRYQTTRHVEEALAAPHRGLYGHGHRRRGADRRRGSRPQLPRQLPGTRTPTPC